MKSSATTPTATATSDNSVTTIWEPFYSLVQHLSASSQHTALVILNQPLRSYKREYVESLWNNASLRICVDGGANRLHEWCSTASTTTTTDLLLYKMVPDFICGDLDSIGSSAVAFYASLGSKCVYLPNQNFTDFTKTIKFIVNCIKHGQVDADLVSDAAATLANDDDDKNRSTLLASLAHRLSEKFVVAELRRAPIERIYCLADFGGRLDHCMANLNTLYDECLTSDVTLRTYLVTSESITFLLRPGENLISLEDGDASLLNRYCGLMPVGRPARVSTRGLRWNMTDQLTQFGGLLSTSNEFDTTSNHSAPPHVWIKCDQPVVWTMSIK